MSSSGSDEEAAGFDDCDFYEDDGEIYPNLFRDLKSRMKSIKADVHKALKSLPPEPTQTHDEVRISCLVLSTLSPARYISPARVLAHVSQCFLSCLRLLHRCQPFG